MVTWTATAPLVFPLLSAVIYVAGALLLKRAAELGAGTWRMAWTCNVTAALVFAPLLLLGGSIPSWGHWYQPAVVALLFVAGQVLGLHALQVGDVSVATPVLGLKVVLVGLFTVVLLDESLRPSLWAAAVLSSLALALLNWESGTHRRVGATIGLASLAAGAYALFDVLVQRWSPAWGAGRFLPVTMAFVGLFSVPMRAGEHRTHSVRTDRPARWLLAGAICLATQSVFFVLTIAQFGQATVANVLYSSRGLWSVVAVWLVGHWFAVREQHLGGRVLGWRLCGAAVLMTAIVLVLFRGPAKPLG